MQYFSDFFFGDVHIGEKTREHSIMLRDAIELGSICGKKHFTGQIRRFLRQHGQLVLAEPTSHPPFPEFLKLLDTQEIGFVQIGARDDVNSNVPATLDCNLFFVEGIVNVRPHWTAYKELRAWEIANTLLLPLHQSGLIERTITGRSSRGVEKIDTNIEQQIDTLFRLSGHPYSSVTHGKMEQYLELIKKHTRG